MNLNVPLQQIKGIGEKTAAEFEAAGLHTVNDLIHFLPRAYEDFSHVTTIADIHPGKMTIKARCEKITTRPVRRGLRITTATLADETGKLQAVWFNQPYRETQLKSGEEFYFSGVFEFNFNKYQLTNPSAEKVSDMPVHTDRILPIYRSIHGLKTTLVRKIMNELRPLMSMVPETLPISIVKSENLVSHSDALLGIHFPEAIDDISKAKERIGFEELFALLLASQLNRIENQKLRGWRIHFDRTIVKAFVLKLPFELTGAQRRAAWDILQDFEKKVPMNRLLQGDVGSGKTVVAGLAARQAAHEGFQTAVMAPTEILATQHAQTLSTLLSPFGVTVGLLTGSVKGKARQTLYDAIKKGDVDVVVGTHALIQSSVNFHRLGFVVIDEQHRFGVNQRHALLLKSAHMPHLLAMTATPIPRSLALTVYGELDVSVLNELPKNRTPVATKIWSPNSRMQLYGLIESQLIKGRQAYVICSLIDNNPDNELKSVQAEFKRLDQKEFKHRTIGLLHGKMTATEKNEIMKRFTAGKIDILVSTTVVEVGVDVPNATVILIEDADHFGLAQLHQLRGRVGRSAHQSYCYLMVSSSKTPSRRLKEVEKSNDGFYLAEVDLRLRGPGEIYGRAQHGELNLQVASLADTKLIARTQKAAKAFVESGADLLHYHQLHRDVTQYQRLTTLN
ncbi:MAG: ATP-dependent DNA helicase RecG [Candidatus Microsaccharimonas sossegonensis]|uniref:ATP-dependent DNA helicase RecG n=1 Tax=Candidatus Microsaccharimonas sossegonensis TaxID=2506948 RepID=A0A4Q0AI19_9BACT|nr:MAG: ATP-dependent DNA helicase RecG [Candidatus Microsaccharimonas sossegonensis]